MGGRREKRGWGEGEEAAGGGRGEKKREGRKRGKIYARKARATPKRELGERRGVGVGGKGAGGGEAYPLPPHIRRTLLFWGRSQPYLK